MAKELVYYRNAETGQPLGQITPEIAARRIDKAERLGLTPIEVYKPGSDTVIPVSKLIRSKSKGQDIDGGKSKPKSPDSGGK